MRPSFEINSLKTNSIMEKKLALAVFLNGEYVGSTQLNTYKMTQVKDGNKYRSNYPEEEIKEAIACVCWARKDDLLSNHSFDEFVVKGTII
jgi:hypothetical protein